MNAFTAYLCRKIASIMMIEGSKQQQLTFDKGITNVPSDAICSDNTLQECIGMVYEDGEHRVIQKPKQDREVNGTLLFVHKIPGGETEKDIFQKSNGVYYTLNNTDTKICSCNSNSTVKVVAVGKTLVINVDGTSYYALWKNDSYLNLGTRLPDVEVQFKMGQADTVVQYESGTGDVVHSEIVDYTTKTVGIYCANDGVIDAHEEEYPAGVEYSNLEIKNQEEFNTAVVGIVTDHLNEVKKAKRFCFPFWVRYAMRLYDGTYAGISNPILMMPSVHYNRNVYFCLNDMTHRDPGDHYEIWPATYDPYTSKIYYNVSADINNWQDIVKGIDVFVSEEVRSFDLESNWRIINPRDSEKQGGDVKLYEGIGLLGEIDKFILPAPESTPATQLNYRYTQYIIPKQWTEKEFTDRLMEKSVFYKLLELDAVSTQDFTDASVKIDSYTLVNLTTQTQLDTDDYYSHTSMAAKVMKTYNSRLHLADINRSFFNGFGHFSNGILTHALGDTAREYKIAVYVSSSDGERVVIKNIGDNFNKTFEDFRIWFYYPDPRAYKVEVYDMSTGGKMFTFNLKEHPYLNGAYAPINLPYSGATIPETTYQSVPVAVNNDERIVNRVMVSEADNPFVFNSKGDVTVGNTKIIGLATQTMALGQEEHGTHPLTVFTEDGLYGLKLNSEGVYIASDVFSREVCNNAKSITETDGAVFFSSAKGLMIVVGNSVTCMSEQLSGRSSSPFQDFIKTAIIAYDYRDSLLWIFSGTSTKCWIYSIKSKTFAQYDFGKINNVDQIVTNVVNDYPDYLLQIGSKLYSLLDRPNINADGNTVNNALVLNTYSAHMKSRPMKLENALALKTIFQIRHVSQFTPYTANGQTQKAAMTLRIFASNNLETWVELHSLGGTPWLYYQFQYDFANLIATDRFAGTVTITQERRTNKLR